MSDAYEVRTRVREAVNKINDQIACLRAERDKLCDNDALFDYWEMSYSREILGLRTALTLLEPIVNC